MGGLESELVWREREVGTVPGEPASTQRGAPGALLCLGQRGISGADGRTARGAPKRRVNRVLAE